MTAEADGKHAGDSRPVLLVLTSTYPRWRDDTEPGFVHELARRLTDRFQVIVLGPHAPGAQRRETLDGVEVIRYRYAPERMQTLVNDGGIVTNLKRNRWKLLLVPGFVLAQLWCAWRLIRTRKVHVIHAHWLIPQGLIATWLQRLPGRKVPFVVTSHGADLYALRGPLLQRLQRAVIRRAHAVTVVSEAMRSRVRDLSGEKGKVSVQPMGVDLSHRFVPDPGVIRRRDQLLFVGRLVEKKGLKHLLDALPAVVTRRPDAKLQIAGFGPEERPLRRQVEALGLQEHVQFLGAVPQAELPHLYRRAALFVAPFIEADSGDQEGLGLVLVEAIGCACPLLVGNVLAVIDVLGRHDGDFAVNPLDSKELASRIDDALSGSSIQLRVLALREQIVARFDWQSVASAYSDLLSSPVSPR